MFSNIKIYAFITALLGSTFIGSYITHKVDNAAYEKLELSYKEAEIKVVKDALSEQQRLDEIKTQIALEANQKQQTINTQTRKQLDEISKHVKDTNKYCITWGLVRVLDASILNREASSLPLPSGRLDASCSTFTSSELAKSIINNYGIAKNNANQLDYLIKFWNSVNKK